MMYCLQILLLQCYSMSDLHDVGSHEMARELITQQQELIVVLKQEILRLQEQLIAAGLERERTEKELRNALRTIETLNEKVNNVSENNEALLQTVQVLQREFIKRDISGAVGRLPVSSNPTGQLHLQIIRNLKSKLNNTFVQPTEKQSQRSPFAEYYCYLLHDQTVEESAVSLFNQIVEQKKTIRSSKIRSLGKKNYFHENFRHVFWLKSIENKQKVTQKLYQLLLQQREGLERQEGRGSIIDLDLRRMDLKLDEEKSKSVALEVKKLLEVFELYRPDIRYVQGMSYLAWIFLIRMNAYCSFLCFSNLILSDPFVHALYMFEQPKIRRILAFFDECLTDKRPKLMRHLQAAGVDSQLFLIEWAYTLYSRAFSLRIVAKIWDLWFSQGYNTFFKVAMTILQLLQGELMDLQDNDRLIDTIRSSCFKIEEAEFLRVLGKQKLFEQLKLQ